MQQQAVALLLVLHSAVHRKANKVFCAAAWYHRMYAGGAHAQDQLPPTDHGDAAAEQPARAVGAAQLPAARGVRMCGKGVGRVWDGV